MFYFKAQRERAVPVENGGNKGRDGSRDLGVMVREEQRATAWGRRAGGATVMSRVVRRRFRAAGRSGVAREVRRRDAGGGGRG